MSATGCVVDYSPKQFTKFKSLHITYVFEKNHTIKIYMIGMMLYVPIILPSEEDIESYKSVQIKSE